MAQQDENPARVPIIDADGEEWRVGRESATTYDCPDFLDVVVDNEAACMEEDGFFAWNENEGVIVGVLERLILEHVKAKALKSGELAVFASLSWYWTALSTLVANPSAKELICAWLKNNSNRDWFFAETQRSFEVAGKYCREVFEQEYLRYEVCDFFLSCPRSYTALLWQGEVSFEEWKILIFRASVDELPEKLQRARIFSGIIIIVLHHISRVVNRVGTNAMLRSMRDLQINRSITRCVWDVYGSCMSLPEFRAVLYGLDPLLRRGVFIGVVVVRHCTLVVKLSWFREEEDFYVWFRDFPKDISVIPRLKALYETSLNALNGKMLGCKITLDKRTRRMVTKLNHHNRQSTSACHMCSGFMCCHIPDHPPRSCAGCRQPLPGPEKTMRCYRCRAWCYCDTKCQKKHWKASHMHWCERAAIVTQEEEV